MHPKRHPPSPIFDNLDHIGNPFRRKIFNVDHIAPSDKKIPAATLDYEYALKFLYSYNGSTATFNSYRREMERLIQWSWLIQGCAAVSLKREDIEEFIRFCISPPLAWIGTKNVARFKTLSS